MADTQIITPSEVGTAPADVMGVNVGDRLNGLYYYYLENDMFLEEECLEDRCNLIYNTSVLGTTDAICNVTYAPFLNISKGDLTKIPYDTDRFGDVTGSGKPNVFRVFTKYKPTEMELITKQLYHVEKPTQKHTVRDFKYEPKLQEYPYRSIIFYSNVFDKYQVIPHLVDRDTLTHGHITLRACTPMSAQGSFYLYVHGYKDKTKNSILERYFVNSSMDIPNTSSAYSNFMATQKATNSVQHQQKLHEANMMPIMNMVNAGSIAGVGIGAITGAYQGIKSTQFAVNEQVARKQDLITTPNSLKSAGGDLLTRLGVASGTEVFAGELTITDEYKNKIADYFAMYGYKVNSIINLGKVVRTRYYYNYVKTVGCEFINSKIPQQYLQQLKQIFDNGVTLWHVGREGVKMHNYGYDNTEISIVGE